VKNRFQNLPFKCNLQRYAKGPIGGYLRKDGRTEEEATTFKAQPAVTQPMDGDAADAAAWAAAGDAPEEEGQSPEEGAEGAEGAEEDDGGEMVPWRYAPHMMGMSATPIPRTVVGRYSCCIRLPHSLKAPVKQQRLVSTLKPEIGYPGF
jgi:hypothetical protein